MNITKELLVDLDIVSISIVEKDKTIICCLVKVEKNQFLFKFSGIIDFSNQSQKELSITTKDNNSSFLSVSKTAIVIIEYGHDYFLCKINSSDEIIKRILERLSHLEYQDEKYGRRKEPRITIGKERAQIFGLSSLEQKIFFNTEKKKQPCFIVDVSLHGISIITPFYNDFSKKLDNFIIQVSFSNPEQNVLLQAHKVHTKLNHSENKTFATISCQLLEPINYIWKERVIKMLETSENH
jgi:predicted metal-binding transcription factor (methanogenesis marker protein 9)